MLKNNFKYVKAKKKRKKIIKVGSDSCIFGEPPLRRRGRVAQAQAYHLKKARTIFLCHSTLSFFKKRADK